MEQHIDAAAYVPRFAVCNKRPAAATATATATTAACLSSPHDKQPVQAITATTARDSDDMSVVSAHITATQTQQQQQCDALLPCEAYEFVFATLTHHIDLLRLLLRGAQSPLPLSQHTTSTTTTAAVTSATTTTSNNNNKNAHTRPTWSQMLRSHSPCGQQQQQCSSTTATPAATATTEARVCGDRCVLPTLAEVQQRGRLTGMAQRRRRRQCCVSDDDDDVDRSDTEAAAAAAAAATLQSAYIMPPAHDAGITDDDNDDDDDDDDDDDVQQSLLLLHLTRCSRRRYRGVADCMPASSRRKTQCAYYSHTMTRFASPPAHTHKQQQQQQQQPVREHVAEAQVTTAAAARTSTRQHTSLPDTRSTTAATTTTATHSIDCFLQTFVRAMLVVVVAEVRCRTSSSATTTTATQQQQQQQSCPLDEMEQQALSFVRHYMPAFRALVQRYVLCSADAVVRLAAQPLFAASSADDATTTTMTTTTTTPLCTPTPVPVAQVYLAGKHVAWQPLLLELRGVTRLVQCFRGEKDDTVTTTTTTTTSTATSVPYVQQTLHALAQFVRTPLCACDGGNVCDGVEDMSASFAHRLTAHVLQNNNNNSGRCGDKDDTSVLAPLRWQHCMTLTPQRLSRCCCCSCCDDDGGGGGDAVDAQSPRAATTTTTVTRKACSCCCCHGAQQDNAHGRPATMTLCCATLPLSRRRVYKLTLPAEDVADYDLSALFDTRVFRFLRGDALSLSSLLSVSSSSLASTRDDAAATAAAAQMTSRDGDGEDSIHAASAVLLHCSAGRHRSAGMAVAYLLWLLLLHSSLPSRQEEAHQGTCSNNSSSSGTSCTRAHLVHTTRTDAAAVLRSCLAHVRGQRVMAQPIDAVVQQLHHFAHELLCLRARTRDGRAR